MHCVHRRAFLPGLARLSRFVECARVAAAVGPVAAACVGVVIVGHAIDSDEARRAAFHRALILRRGKPGEAIYRDGQAENQQKNEPKGGVHCTIMTC